MRVTFLCLLWLCFSSLITSGQTTGGNATYQFLKLPGNPQLSALGGINISNISDDVGMAFNNPSLLRETMHTQIGTAFNMMYAGIRHYQGMLGYRHEKSATNFSLGLQYLNYGAIAQTDAAGNMLGSFRPGDYAVQLSASRQYLSNWYYGIALKFINSNYGLYRSNSVAMDAGFSYYDSTRFIQASLVMKNMGVQLKTYDGINGEDLPFDLQLGITKRLKNAPLQFSLTAHHLHQFDIRYNDTVFNSVNGFSRNNKGTYTLDKIFRHFVLATQAYIGDKVEVTAGYNYLRRAELSISNSTNGLNGFSLGIGVLFSKIQIRYARAYYQNNMAYNQFGLNFTLRSFGLGDFGQRVGW